MNGTMANCSLERLSTAVCTAEPIVLWFSARLSQKFDKASDKAELWT
jgi:hypothetical protein